MLLGGQWTTNSGQKRRKSRSVPPSVHCLLSTGPSRLRRGGFTLLELLLATVIGVLILGGLYVVLNMTVTQTQVSREQVDAEDAARAVFNKVHLDLSSVLGPAPPKSGGTPATGSTASTATAPTTGGTTGGTSGTDTGMDATTDPESTEGEDSAAKNIPFQIGVWGTNTQLSIFAARVPEVLATPGALNAGSADGKQQSSDLVRIDYWMGSGGLCRQERPYVTGDQTGNNFTFDLANEATSVIADEVTAVSFEYHDGTSWVQTWEGGTGTTTAPPVAVKVTLTFTRQNPRGGDPITRTLSQTMAVRTAPGSSVPDLVDPVMTTPTEEPDMSGSGQ